MAVGRNFILSAYFDGLFLILLLYIQCFQLGKGHKGADGSFERLEDLAFVGWRLRT